MVRLRGPLPYQKPPLGSRLDVASSLASGLILYVPANEGGGSRLNDLTGRGGTGTLSGSGSGWASAPDGPALTFNGGGGLASGVSPFGGLTHATWFSRVYISSGAGPAATWWSGNTGYSGSFLFARDAGGSGSATSGQLYIGSAKTNFPILFNVWQDVVVVLNSATVTIYVQGVQVAQAGGQSSVPGHTGYQVGTNSATNLPFTGQVAFYGGHNRALSPGEVTQLHAAPFQMFLPPIYRRYFVAAAGPTNPLITAGTQALLSRVGSDSAGAQALLQGSFHAVAGTQVLLQRAGTTNSAAQVLLQRVGSVPSGAETLLRGSFSAQSGAQALLSKAGTDQTGAQALLQGAFRVQSGTQALFRRVGTASSGTEALLQGSFTVNSGVEALFQGSFSAAAGMQALLSATGRVTDTAAAQALLRGSFTAVSAAQALLLRLGVASAGAHVLLSQAHTASAGMVVLLQRQGTATAGAQAVLQRQGSTESATQALLLRAGSDSAGVQALFQRGGTAVSGAATLLQGHYSRAAAVEGVLSRQGTTQARLAALLTFQQGATSSAQALLLGAFTRQAGMQVLLLNTSSPEAGMVALLSITDVPGRVSFSDAALSVVVLTDKPLSAVSVGDDLNI